MLKKDVVQHFGSQRAIAKALGLSESAVSQWKEVIPEKDAFKIEKITSGALRREPELYRRMA
ncbi:Cro/CI family transcriptional regulator [Klebsiella sp. K4-170]|uniref:Cro/CI family transcriptional regulator n=1 Tax=Klebsiella sp. K4-170 TaxID=2920184 RepID=UPI0024DEDFAC|nr:Cro/CI family transcriptional regulator [Klebsiella sp. K4-170]MDK1901004.1 Cro/CI family transcriptional regulator [Klebsiella sp. K4-170]